MSERAELYPALPDDIPKATWSAWPRKAEAHLAVGARKRQITSRVASGALTAYACPDNTVRIPLDQLQQIFGESKPAPTAPSSAVDRVRQARLTDAELELDDPLVGMFRECRLMLKEEREHSREQIKTERAHSLAQLAARDATNQEQLKLLTGPINSATKLLQETAERLAARVVFLEERQDAVIAERELMADFRQERDVQLETLRGREQRRNEVLSLLKRELGPVLLGKLGGGDSLAAFVSEVRPELIELLIGSGLLSPAQQSKLQRLLEAMKAKASAETPPAAKANGATSAPSEEHPS